MCMQDHRETRRIWRANWLRLIAQFADEASQRRLWLDPSNSNPHYTFVEYFCCYFDDLGLSTGGYKAALEAGLLSDVEAAAVAEFHKAADVYKSPTDDFDHVAILADPRWTDVVTAARQACVGLLRVLEEPVERELLTSP